MSYQGTGWAAKARTGSSNLKNVLMMLGHCASAEGVVFARQSTIIEDSELEEKAFRRNVNRLMQLGFVRIFERRTPAGHRNSNVIVMMLDCQWPYRTDRPVGCAEYFAGHHVTEKTHEGQQKAFENQELPRYGRNATLAKRPAGQTVRKEGTKCPVGPGDAAASDSAENSQSGSLPDTLSGGQSVDEIKDRSLDTRARARDDDGKAGGARPGTLKAWYEGHRALLIEAVGEAKFKSWLSVLIPAQDDGTRAVFWAPSAFMAKQIGGEYRQVLQRVLQRDEVAVVFDSRAAKATSREQRRQRYAGDVTLASGETRRLR